MAFTKKVTVNCNIALLKFIAMFGVVCLHTFGSLSPVESRISYVIWYMSSFSIPVFFAASGYFVLNRQPKISIPLNKVLNILIFILLWGAVKALVFYVYHALKLHDDIDIGYIIREPFELLIKSFFHRGHFSRLWFMWALIILYLLSPYFSKVFKTTRGALHLALLLTILCLGTHIFDMFHIASTNTSMYSYAVNPGLRHTYKIWIFSTYYVWGGVLGIEEVRQWIRLHVKQKIAVVSMLLLTFLTVFYQYQLDCAMVHNSPEYQHDSPLVILWVLSILIVGVCYVNKVSNSTIWHNIADCTLGIYFLHSMVEYFLKGLFPTISLLNLLILAPLTFILSFFITVIMMRITIFKVFVQVPKFLIIR